MPRPFIPGVTLRGAAPRALAAVLLLVQLAAPSPFGASAPGARGRSGMVSGPEPRATAAGIDVLRAGGNAVDAGVAVAFTLAVTYPQAGALGGGGFLLLRADDGSYRALDFRETAPAALTSAAFLDEDGRPVPGRSIEGGLAVGVPGLVAGLAEAHRRWGSKPWSELIAPAIELAEGGFPVYPWLAESLRLAADRVMPDEAARLVFAPAGRPIAPGETLVQVDLGRTLRAIAEKGPAAFYDGPTAAALVGSVRRAGGVMTLEDLAGYRTVERRPLEGSYRGHRVVTYPPPSAGGIILLQALAMLERYDLRSAGAGSSLTVHLMAEVERRAFADRSRWVGDPDFFDVPVRRLLDPAYLAERAASIRPDRATPSTSMAPGEAAPGAAGQTLHFSVADTDGRAAAFTITLNRWFGSGLVAGGTGVLLNNEIDDFALAPGAANSYGLTGERANAIVPGKRPVSSMTPTIVERPGGGPRPLLVLGSPGGATIPTSVLQVLVNFIDHRMPLQEAVDAPRFHHQWQPDLLRHETRAFPADVVVNLVARGHTLEPAEGPLGNVNAIALDADGVWVGAADPRRQGSAAGH